MTGEKILNYRIENLTDDNQLYRSFLATHTQFSKKVLIKSIKPFGSLEDNAEFREEIKRLSQIQHPHVVTLYDQVETEQELYLIFEYIEGKTLSDYINQISGPIPAQRAAYLMAKILDAFAQIHQKVIFGGAVHASNLLVWEDEEVKVLDLALSRFFHRKNLEAGDVESLSYASPEWYQEQKLGISSDIYSLGILFYYMLAGQHPYGAYTSEQLRQGVPNHELPDIRNFYPSVPASLWTIIKKATSLDPRERYASSQAFKADILQADFSPSQVIEPSPVPEAGPNTPNQPSYTEEVKREDVVFINLPLFILIGLLVFMSVLLLRFNRGEEQVSSQVIYEITNTQSIRQRQDSIAQAQEKQAIADSIRILSLANRKQNFEIYIHKVKRGENLEYLAQRYYTNPDSLRSLNNMEGVSNTARLRAREGIKIKIRALYSMKRGESLYDVSRKFGVSHLALRQTNQLFAKEPEPGEEPEPIVFEGKQLVIPLIAAN